MSVSGEALVEDGVLGGRVLGEADGGDFVVRLDAEGAGDGLDAVVEAGDEPVVDGGEGTCRYDGTHEGAGEGRGGEAEHWGGGGRWEWRVS